MKRNLLLFVSICLVALVSVAQNDSMYLMKDGLVVAKYNVHTEVDSIIFYKPTAVSDTYTDARDGNVYQLVSIGNQRWMAENLRYLPFVDMAVTESDTEPHYYVYDYDGTDVEHAKQSDNYQTYGVLYNFAAAQVVCPEGWHLPSHTDWTELTDFLGGTDIAGAKLKEAGTTHWNAPNTGATNSSGFTALPAGARTGYGFDMLHVMCYWWSATEQNATEAWLRYLYSGYSSVTEVGSAKKLGYSVRCLKDDTI